MKKRLKDDLKILKLDGDTVDGFTYVNTFITKHNELSRIGASESQPTMMSHFVDNIEDEDFSVVKELLQGILLRVDHGETSLNTKEFYDSVVSRQKMLTTQTTKSIHRTKTGYKRGGCRVQKVVRKNVSSPPPPPLLLSLIFPFRQS